MLLLLAKSRSVARSGVLLCKSGFFSRNRSLRRAHDKAGREELLGGEDDPGSRHMQRSAGPANHTHPGSFWSPDLFGTWYYMNPANVALQSKRIQLFALLLRKTGMGYSRLVLPIAPDNCSPSWLLQLGKTLHDTSNCTSRLPDGKPGHRV